VPDLGKYAVEVLAAYGVSLLLLGGLVLLSVRRSRQIKAQLAKVENNG
jgi:heme exporter protein D